MWCTFVFVHVDELLSVKTCITSLPSGTDADDLELYFETICDDKVEIVSLLREPVWVLLLRESIYP